MTAQAKALKVNETDIIEFDSTADMNGGDIVAVPDGRYGIRLGTAPSKSGDRVAVAVKGQVRIDSVDSATKFATAGSKVAWDAAGSKAVAGSTSGKTVIGIAIAATASNGDPVTIDLNETPAVTNA